MNPLIEIEDLRKQFEKPTKVQVLRGLHLKVAKGEKIAIMGKSGEGKSTLLHILGALEKPSSGLLKFHGKSYQEHALSKLRSLHIGFIFQAFNLLEEYTSLGNLLMPAKIARKPVSKGSDAYKRALHLLERVGLTERKDFPIKLLSGGEKQRVAIARALMNNPELLLADEPSGNLDSATSHLIYQLLLDCIKEEGKTLIVVTHDATLAALCDRTLILKDG
ncbi:MAG: ABC transporter ATP-binding protein, partial [Chlamydiales bacterium]